MNVSVVVPVYRSARTLPQLVERLEKVLAPLCSDYEILLVNDCSPDDTWSVIEKLMEQPHVFGFDLMRNYGQHNAMLCGIRAAQFEYIITVDDDLQHPPESIPPLLHKLEEGWDVVYGTPIQLRHSGWRNFAALFTKRMLQLSMGVSSAVEISSFRAFRTSLREAFERNASPQICVDVLLSWGTTKFTSVPVDHNEREIGSSNYNLFKLLTHALNLLTGFSTLPLRLACWNGFICMVFGLIALVYVVAKYFWMGTPVPGFPFLASIILIFAGAQLFALGIIGEYIGRIFVRNMDRPSYVVRRAKRSSAVTSADTREHIQVGLSK